MNPTAAEVRRVKWDTRHLDHAEFVSRASKDPSTQTGAVIIDPFECTVSTGYNGFPRGIEDTPERLNDRDVKYALVVHCEMNAVLTANRSVRGCTLYTWPFGSCTRCAVHMIQAGIARVVFPMCPPSKAERWGVDMARAEALYREAGLIVQAYGPVLP